MIAELAKAGLQKLGLSMTGLKGWLIMIGVKYFAKNAGQVIGETSDAIRDQENIEKHNEVINNENATLDDKIKSELDLLNGG